MGITFIWSRITLPSSLPCSEFRGTYYTCFMKQTAPLKVMFDARIHEHDLQINPNDGFDLGLMTSSYPVTIVGDSVNQNLAEAKDLGYGRIYLKNEVANNTLIMSKKWQARLELSRTGQVRLCYEDGKVGFLKA